MPTEETIRLEKILEYLETDRPKKITAIIEDLLKIKLPNLFTIPLFGEDDRKCIGYSEKIVNGHRVMDPHVKMTIDAPLDFPKGKHGVRNDKIFVDFPEVMEIIHPEIHLSVDICLFGKSGHDLIYEIDTQLIHENAHIGGVVRNPEFCGLIHEKLPNIYNKWKHYLSSERRLQERYILQSLSLAMLLIDEGMTFAVEKRAKEKLGYNEGWDYLNEEKDPVVRKRFFEIAETTYADLDYSFSNWKQFLSQTETKYLDERFRLPKKAIIIS